ncbi:YIP1 family protein [Candidatus Woesearchaeota archaeon]|nr:YIP1 family protein [Candidatus Woesearchaeota archaeon]
MNFVGKLKQGFEILKLDKKEIMKVANDESSTKAGVLFLALAGVAASIGSFAFLAIFPIIVLPIFVILGFAIGVGIYHILAKLFGGSGTYMQLFRVVSVTSFLNWIAVIPILGSILSAFTSIWSLVVAVVAVREVHKLSTGKAVAVIVIPLVVALVIMMVVFVLGIMAVASLQSLANLPQ